MGLLNWIFGEDKVKRLETFYIVDGKEMTSEQMWRFCFNTYPRDGCITYSSTVRVLRNHNHVVEIINDYEYR